MQVPAHFNEQHWLNETQGWPIARHVTASAVVGAMTDVTRGKATAAPRPILFTAARRDIAGP